MKGLHGEVLNNFRQQYGSIAREHCPGTPEFITPSAE